MGNESAARPRPSRVLAATSIFLFVFGAKLVLIGRYGNITPFWDQWDAEAASLYKPYLDGALDWPSLLDSHNEHRILFARLLFLLLLETVGEWDPIVQMVVNSGIHAAVVVMIVWLCWDLVQPRERMAVSLVTALAFYIPFGWENLLWGFQAQYYFLVIFSLATLWVVVYRPAFDRWWWLALIFCICACFSIASGAFAALSAVAILTLQIVLKVRRPTPREVAAILIFLTLAGVAVFFTESVPRHEALKAHSVSQFVYALIKVAATPFGDFGWLLHVPLVWLAWRVLRAPHQASKPEWLALTIAGWVLMQMVSLAYGRAVGVDSSRYQDFLIILLPLDFAALLMMIRPMSTRPLVDIAAAIACLILWTEVSGTKLAVSQKANLSITQERNTRAYLLTGDPAALDQPHLHIPYPSAERLAMLLSDPTIRMVLPAALRPPDASVETLHGKLALGGVFAEPVRWAKTALLGGGWLLMAVGGSIWLWLAGLTLRGRTVA